MSKYERQKVDELKQILTDRKLPTTGRKSDLVARLVEADEAAANKSTATSTAKPETAPSTGKENASTPADPKPATKETAPATTTKEDSKDSKKEDDDREAKLAARAARFGISKDEEAERKRARAARFGESTNLPEDKALSQPKASSSSAGKKEQPNKTKDNKTKEQQQTKRKTSVLDDPVEAEKARKRALKFGTAPVDVPASSAATAAVAK